MSARYSTARRSLLAGLVLCAALGPGCSGGGGGVPDVAAVVQGVEIDAKDTEALIDTYVKRQKVTPQQDLPRDEIAKLVLDYQIKLTLVEHLAASLDVSAPEDSELDEKADLINPEAYGLIGQRREDFVRELRVSRLSKAIAKKLYPEANISEEALRDEYERRAPILDRNWKANAHVARFNAQQPAQQVRERVAQGEAFDDAATALGAEAVATVDINPVVAPLSAEVLDAVGQLKSGEISEAISAGGVWLSVLIEDRQEVPRLSLEDLRVELTDILAEKQRDELFQEWFEKEFSKAKIEVDDHYGTWNRESKSVK